MRRASSGAETVHIDAPPEQVYGLVSDVTRMGEWSPETYRCRWIDADGPARGARFKGDNRRGQARWSNTLVVLSVEPGREFAFRRDVRACGMCDWTKATAEAIDSSTDPTPGTARVQEGGR